VRLTWRSRSRAAVLDIVREILFGAPKGQVTTIPILVHPVYVQLGNENAAGREESPAGLQAQHCAQYTNDTGI
jgi:hypothetical protein